MQTVSSQWARTTGFRAEPVKNSPRNTAGSIRRLKAAFFNSTEITNVDRTRRVRFSFPHRLDGCCQFHFSFSFSPFFLLRWRFARKTNDAFRLYKIFASTTCCVIGKRLQLASGDSFTAPEMLHPLLTSNAACRNEKCDMRKASINRSRSWKWVILEFRLFRLKD